MFTALAHENCDLLTLSVADLDKMRIEFPEAYLELYNDGFDQLKGHLIEKKRKIKQCVMAK